MDEGWRACVRVEVFEAIHFGFLEDHTDLLRAKVTVLAPVNTTVAAYPRHEVPAVATMVEGHLVRIRA
jgi:hypothetical protein